MLKAIIDPLKFAEIKLKLLGPPAEKAFPLFDGSFLRYRPHAGVRGGMYRWITSQPTKELQTLPKFKNQQPLLGLWNTGTDQNVVCADYDKLPEDFLNWNHLADHLRTHPLVTNGNAVVIRPYASVRDSQGRAVLVDRPDSRKVKLLIAIQFKGKMTVPIAESILQELDCPQGWGTEASGYRQCYVSPENAVILKNALPRLIPVTHVSEELVSPELSPDFEGKGRGHGFSKGSTPSIDYFVYRGSVDYSLLRSKLPRSADKFLRVILERRDLLKPEGHFIPQEHLGEFLGIAQTAVSKYVRLLVKCGYLEKLKEGCYSRKEAAIYKASGELRRIMTEIHEKPKTPTKTLKDAPASTPTSRPTSVAPGYWETVLWAIALDWEGSDESYMEWASALPDINEERLIKARRAITRARNKI